MINGNEDKAIVRLAKLADIKAIYKFVCELEDCHLDEKTFEKAYYLNLFDVDNIYLVAELVSEVIGYLSCHSQLLLHHGGRSVGEIQEMYVDSERRNLGVGKLLLDKLKELAASKNIIQIEVTSNKLRDNTHRFYERENFEQTHKKFVYVVE